MPYIAGIGHRLPLQNFLDKWGFEDIDEAEIVLEEAGITIFVNDEEVFIVNNDKYKIIENGKYYDLNFKLTEDEENILLTYVELTDKRVKLFWVESEEENPTNMMENILERMVQLGDSI
jgi:hypothetical protein